MKLRSIRQDLKLRLDVQLKHLELCMKWLRLFRLGRLKGGVEGFQPWKKKFPSHQTSPQIKPIKVAEEGILRWFDIQFFTMGDDRVEHAILPGMIRTTVEFAPRRSTLWESRVYNVLDLYMYIIIQKIGYFIGVFRMNFHINSIWFTGKGVPARHIPILAFCSWGKWWSACDFWIPCLQTKSQKN